MSSAATTTSESSGGLSPLPLELHRGLTAVTVLGLLSFISTTALSTHLAYRFVTWRHRAHARVNQYAALLLNLILADLQQAVGFTLNAEWVRSNSITPLTATCWTQGWFLNAGDVGSAIFTFAMAVHLFADIVFDRRLGYKSFISCIVGLWTFDYLLATIGVIMHPKDFYMRAGPWCWINDKYMDERIWLHYLWILAVEFGVALMYFLMFLVLWRRVRALFYADSDIAQARAESAARSVIIYPIVYVVCTLPAVIGRLKLLNPRAKVNFIEFSVIGVMMASNGWLDVLLYTITRKSLVFGSDVPDESARGLQTFTTWNRSRGRGDPRCRTTTTIEAGPASRNDIKHPEAIHIMHRSLEELFVRGMRIRAETVVHIESGPDTELILQDKQQEADAQSFGSFERQCNLDVNNFDHPQETDGLEVEKEDASRGKHPYYP